MDVKRIGTVVDTANRRRDKKIPKSRAEDFQALVSINADAMVVLDHEGYVLYVNPAAESLFSLPSAEMVGAFFGFPIILDEPVELHVLREFKDFVGVEMRMVEVKWAGEASYLLSFRDLTDRIKAEQAMSRARGELDGMVTQRTIELSEINRQLKREITERKRAEEERTRLIHDLGERLKELKALHSTYVIFQKADAIPEILQEITTSLPLAWQYPEITAARISFNGQKYLTPNFLETPWVQRADFRISGGRNGSIEVCYTKERPGEAEGPFLAEERALIDSLAEMLRTYLDKRFTEEALVEAKAQAELYLDLMGHDINNMHQIALGYLELAQGTPSGVQRDEMIEKPIEVLQRCAQLIKNVRKLQKHGEGVIPSGEYDIVRVLSDVNQEFGAVPDKTITLSLNGNRHCYVLANELLYDVFVNLVSNAIKHTGERASIAINLDVANDNGGRCCKVSVEEDGPGVPDDFKAVIFNRMQKGTNKAKGMGLGLYLVKSLVDSYGGRVWAEDRVKGDHTKGARFMVMLPVVENH